MEIDEFGNCCVNGYCSGADDKTLQHDTVGISHRIGMITRCVESFLLVSSMWNLRIALSGLFVSVMTLVERLGWWWIPTADTRFVAGYNGRCDGRGRKPSIIHAQKQKYINLRCLT